MVHLVKVPSSLVLVLLGNTFCAGHAWIDASTGFKRGNDTIKYHVYLVTRDSVFQTSSSTFLI